MAVALTPDMSWSDLYTKEDLLRLFSGLVDQEVIEMVVEGRNDDLLLSYKDLIELTKSSNPDQNKPFVEEISKSDSYSSNTSSVINWDRLSKNESPTNRILYLVTRGYKVMVLMRGCPGSGKSTQAINILNSCYKNVNADEFIFSADKFFINKHTGRYCYDRSKLRYAHQKVFESTQSAVKKGITPVIIDNTNILLWEMENYAKLAVNNGYWIEIVEPVTEWAWNGMELFKRTTHSVPFDKIIIMMNQYEHTVVDDMLIRFKLKYNRNNQPPQLSNGLIKYQLCESEKNVVNIPLEEINDGFKDFVITHHLKNDNDCIMQSDGFDPTVEQEIHEKEKPLFENSSQDFSDADEECQSISSIEEASNYANKSVNTCENDFLFMGVLNEIPEEEYSNYVIYGTDRDINEGKQSTLDISSGKLNKGTTTNDLIEVIYKPNLKEISKWFPENVCALIIELFEQCNGNIDWIVEMLVESGYDISKQQMQNLIQPEDNSTKDNHFQETTEKLRSNMQISQDNNLSFTSNLQPRSVKNKILDETDGKKKHRKKVTKGIKSQNKNNNLRKNIENKFVFGDSLYSEHVLKIKKFKENQNSLDNDNIVMPSGFENTDGKIITEDEEKFVQLVVDTSVLTQLCDYFGDISADLNKTMLPMSVKLPEKLAEDLYYCLIANVPTDICDQEAILQDESLARKLQDECKAQCSSKTSSSNTLQGELTFAAVLSKKLLLEKFKHLETKLVLDVLRTNDYKFQETNDVLSNIGCLTNQNQNCPNTMENRESHDNEIEYDAGDNHDYRKEALEHADLRQKFLNKANQSLTSKIHPAVTAYYLDRAEESKKNEKYAKTKSIMNIIKQNEDDTILDLHFMPVQDAILVLDLYLDNHISNMRKPQSGGYSISTKQLTIITGRGKHSPKGIARIKPVVVRRLTARQLIFFEPEKSGLLRVMLKKNSYLSSEF